MLFLQVLLFFLFGIPASALFGEETPPGSGHRVQPDISVEAPVNARGWWYRDHLIQGIREVMDVQGIMGGSTRIKFGEVKITNADSSNLNLRPSLESMYILGTKELGLIIGDWERFPRVCAILLKFDDLSRVSHVLFSQPTGYLPSALHGQKAECVFLSHDKIKITVAEPVAPTRRALRKRKTLMQ